MISLSLPPVSVLLALPLLWAGAACSSSGNAPGPTGNPVTINVVDVDGQSIPAFALTVTDGMGETHGYACGFGDSSEAQCGPNGVTLANVTGDFVATVKSHGYTFWHGTIRLSETRPTDRGRAVDIPLTALAPFEHSADYDTGYEPDAGLDPFEAAAVAEGTELGPTQVVKFYIANVQTTPTVYFQNTKTRPLHYTFTRDVLKIAQTSTQFEASTYHGADRTAMAGSILRRQAVQTSSVALGATLSAPISVTFFPSDDLTPDQALLAHRLIEERMGFASFQGGQDRVVYEPGGSEQAAALSGDVATFAEWGSLWVNLSEIYGSLTVQFLNPGLAYGTLRLLSPEQLQTEIVSFTDILLLPRLPIELPVVGGTITEEMQTPLAHVNVAARTRGSPNLALKNASTDPRVKDYIGKLVRFEVKSGRFSLTEATQQEAEQYWASRTQELRVPTFDDTTTGLFGFDSIGFSDAVRVGVKAANLAELSHLLGPKAPTGFAVPFYYYDQFMRTSMVTGALCDAALTDCVAEGRAQATCDAAYALCQPTGGGPESFRDYAVRLLANGEFQTDSQLREAALDGLRHLMRNTPVSAEFAGLLDSQVTVQFGTAKVRIRSSTNSEDLDDFSGTGLYDSVSANTPAQGAPSTEIRKVWASVWNWRAFEERAFWNIDHLAVRVGCAVTQAFSDEAANGVLITQNIAEPATAGMYVNVQAGETSVTNPTDGSLPEVFSIVSAPDGVQVQRQRFSTLSPDVPLLSDDEVSQLFATCNQVQYHFAPLYGDTSNSLALDIEFKFNQPDRSLIIKQVRPYTAL